MSWWPVTGGTGPVSWPRRRNHAVIVRDLDDDAATIIMVDSNLQRESLLPSERAFAYKMKLEAMKHQGERMDLTCSQVGNKSAGKKSSELLAEQVGQSKNQIFRYIRLTELIPELLDMVDEKKIALTRLMSCLSSKKRNSGLAGRDGQRTGHPLSLPGPAAQEIQPGRTSDPRYDARHHGRGKEKRSRQSNPLCRHPAEVFSQVLRPSGCRKPSSSCWRGGRKSARETRNDERSRL